MVIYLCDPIPLTTSSKYEPESVFGVVNSPATNIVWTENNAHTTTRQTGAGKAYVGANERVLCWDVKRGELLSIWKDKTCRSQVTALSQCPSQHDLFAVGHADGSIRIWDAISANVLITFNGHRSAVTHLAFDRDGSRLASGSRDTDIIVWDLLAETSQFRLRGHKDQITGLAFLDAAEDASLEQAQDYLLSTSKDASVKIWDLITPHCIETHVVQTNGECWSLGVSPDGLGCITAGNDGELKIWSIDKHALASRRSALDGDDNANVPSDCLVSQGIFLRQGKDRTQGLSFHPRGSYVAVHGADKSVEILRLRSEDEVKRHIARRRRRRKEKAATTGQPLPDDDEVPTVLDAFVSHVIIRTGGKVSSVAWTSGRSTKTIDLVCSDTNNQLEVYSISCAKDGKDKTETEYNRTLLVDMPGHRTDVRALALSSDDRMLASASAGNLKIWNTKTQSCLRTLECGQSLCCAFLPGDKIVLVGTKTGEVEVYDIASSSLIDKFQAHDGAVWTLQVHPDGKSAVTGGADKSARFWKFDIVQVEVPGTLRTTPQLKLTQTRQLKVTDDVLNVCFSPDSRLLAVATLDNTVKVFFVDSLKLFLTLYGHKLPVLNISISSDSKLIATCSADKNVRLWGLDFGDCHKAFFAHQDSVMQVGFIPHPQEADEVHRLFSASKDSVIKSWDGDKFEQIQKMDGHHGEVWAMAISRTGETVFTASHDKSIRSWTIGDDLIFLEEEREKELEEMYESTLATQLDRDYGDEEQEEVGTASKQTISTLTHGEKIIEALEVGAEDLELSEQFKADREKNPDAPPPQRNVLFMALGGISAEQHVSTTISKIPAAALQDALQVIPFSTLPVLFAFILILIRQRMQPEVAWRVFYYLLQTHNNQLVGSKQLKGVMSDILEAYTLYVKDQKAVLGFNKAALGLIGREVRDGDVYSLENEKDELERLDRGRKKRVFSSVA